MTSGERVGSFRLPTLARPAPGFGSDNCNCHNYNSRSSIARQLPHATFSGPSMPLLALLFAPCRPRAPRAALSPPAAQRAVDVCTSTGLPGSAAPRPGPRPLGGGDGGCAAPRSASRLGPTGLGTARVVRWWWLKRHQGRPRRRSAHVGTPVHTRMVKLRPRRAAPAPRHTRPAPFTARPRPARSPVPPVDQHPRQPPVQPHPGPRPGRPARGWRDRPARSGPVCAYRRLGQPPARRPGCQRPPQPPRRRPAGPGLTPAPTPVSSRPPLRTRGTLHAYACTFRALRRRWEKRGFFQVVIDSLTSHK